MFNKIHEYLVYIHGISKVNDRSHDNAYDKLHEGIQSVKRNFPNRSTWDNANRCNVEWGWSYSKNSELRADHLLAEAQKKMAERILPKICRTRDFSLNPARCFLSPLRELMLKGFSDMFYYTSRDGKSSIRATVASQIIQCIKEPLEKNEPISITFLGHSAGSVIAFDFLFYLFAPHNTLERHEFIEPVSDTNTSDTLNNFQKLRELADNNKLRVRRLITFGSPISMLAFRSNNVLEILASGDQLNSRNYGLDQNHEVFGEPLIGPRWINFWDKDDIISWPVKQLMQNVSFIEDVYTDVGDSVINSHNKYWNHKKVHEKIAKFW